MVSSSRSPIYSKSSGSNIWGGSEGALKANVIRKSLCLYDYKCIMSECCRDLRAMGKKKWPAIE